VAIAVHNYVDTYKVLPSSHINYRATQNLEVYTPTLNHSGLALILPFMEQQPLHSKMDFRFPTGPSQHSWNTASPVTVPQQNQDAVATLLESYLCPSDDAPKKIPLGLGTTYGQANVEAAKTNYDFNTHAQHTLGGRSQNYMSQSQPLLMRMFGVNGGVSFEIVLDGTTNTVMLSETTRRVHNGNSTAWGYRGWVMTGHDIGHNTTQARGINCWTYNNTPTTTLYGRLGNWGTTGSLHPGGANFALGDASVRFIAETTDLAVLGRLSAAADRQPVGPF
jgi:hypothetical protein